jgi:hypothetical protein
VLESVHEGAEDFADLLTPETFAVLVVSRDEHASFGWRVDAKVAEWLTPAKFAAVLRQSADRYDPPQVVEFAAEHQPDCPCPRCVASRSAQR